MKENTSKKDKKAPEKKSGNEKGKKKSAAKKENGELINKAHELEIQSLNQEIEKLNEQILRRAAEFENFKKRKEREVDEFWKTANAGLIKKILPIVDDFERSIAAAKTDHDCDALLKGIDLVYKSLQSLLKDEGVEEIDALNQPFDPEIHEALMQIENEDADSNIVLDQHQKGYKLGDVLLRPAQVVVSK
ncbi:MAG: nucleotide exchange factor GrpE [Calditrichaeota bacterium]|nr:MAG: nucleotide exchange factor GrpE [Calditrichota bacterium]